MIFYKKFKEGRPAKIPLPPPLSAVLREYGERVDSVWLFP